MCFDTKLSMRNFSHYIKKYGNQGSVISVATQYRLDGSVFNPGGTRYFLFGLNWAGRGANLSCAVGTGPSTWNGPDMALTTHPNLAPMFRLDKAIPLLSLCLRGMLQREVYFNINKYEHLNMWHFFLRSFIVLNTVF